MNDTIKALFERKSVRAFEKKEIPAEHKALILESAIQAPTAGNQILYTILDITDQEKKDRLAVLCDNQPFIATAPLVLIFLADCRRWLDSYRFAGIEARNPGLGDLMLSCSDACIAAQNTVVAAESLGIGSCYIGDVMEREEDMRELLALDSFVFPIAMLVYGYPTEQQKERRKPSRFEREYIVLENTYRRLSGAEHREMYQRRGDLEKRSFEDFMKAFCERKYMSDFSLEMSRSVGKYLENFRSADD